ncbi:MAG: hypothetical protein JWO53_1108 [Chlamydiia bacterium]|nr:hypothetical protein [Chlamydiia bacterium]
MKLAALQKNFPNSEMRHVLTAGHNEPSENTFAQNLLKSEKREQVTQLYLERLVDKCESSWATRCMYKFVAEWQKPEYASALSKKTTALCKKILAPYRDTIDKKIKKKQEKAEKTEEAQKPPTTTQVSKSSSLDQFPEEWCALGTLKARADELKACNFKKGKKIIAEIKRRVKIDPAIQGESTNDAKKAKHKAVASKDNPPFDKNRTGKNVQGASFLNATDAHFNNQNFILSALPKTIDCARSYFDAAIQQGATVFVSLHERGEAKSRCNNFWGQDTLSKIVLHDTRTIAKAAQKVLIEGQKDAKSKGASKIVESILQVANGKTITHLHYDGWHDRHPMPDEQVFQLMLDRMEELNPNQETPLAINCKGGVGRTGTTAISYLLRKQVDAAVAAGINLEEIKVNIPELIYAFRKQRSGVLSQEAQLVQIYSVLGSYYERLKIIRDIHTFPLPVQQILSEYAPNMSASPFTTSSSSSSSSSF